MSREAKISQSFEALLANRGPNDRCDAIVIYKSPGREPRARGRLRELKAKLDSIKRSQRRTQRKISAHYQEISMRAFGGKSELTISEVGGSALPIGKAAVTRRTLPALAENPDVVAILPNQRIHLLKPKRIDFTELRKRETRSGLTWGLEALDVPELWRTSKGQDINVAVLDTGVYGDHPALNDRIKDFVVIDPLGRRIAAQPAFDGGSHGTHVCGTIAGGKADGRVSIGVAPEANLLVGAVLVGESTLLTLLEGLSWAIEKEVDIVNMSLGFTYYEPLFAIVFERLLSFGLLPVVAIGNENHGNTSSPGSAHNALSVGAAEQVSAKKLDVAFFSSGASLVFPGQEPEAFVTKPDVAAPGVDVLSSIPPERRVDGTHEYAYFDGTSMATPHVAGVAALLMAAEPDSPVEDIARALKETAHHPGGEEARPDNRWGYGIIRPVEALKALRS